MPKTYDINMTCSYCEYEIRAEVRRNSLGRYIQCPSCRALNLIPTELLEDRE